MNRHCPSCNAILGPAEGRSCISCEPTSRPETNRDLIVAVLEQSATPLNTWDIEREAKALYRRLPVFGYLAYERRLCWAGRSIWGLYRHGMVPGVRRLSEAAAVFVHAAGPITTKELYFVMRRVGYRISPNSLTATLTYEPWVERNGWLNMPMTSKTVRDEMRRGLRLQRGLTLTDVLERAREQVDRELIIFRERLY